jgi:hypothetical protein
MRHSRIILYFTIFFLVVSCGDSSSPKNSIPVLLDSLRFDMNAPSVLNDYEQFSITFKPLNLQSGETLTLSMLDTENQVFFPKIENLTLSGRAPFTYSSRNMNFTAKFVSSQGREALIEVNIPISYNHVAEQFNTPDGLLNFNPSASIQAILENDNYASWDIIPWLRGERKKIPEGTYCYPTPEDCVYNPGEWPPGFIPGDIVPGDFDGDGHEDVIFVADIGDRVFKSKGSDEDPSYWSTIHILFNDGSGRLSEDFSKYENNKPPRLPAPYHIEVSDFNNDGIDDAFIGSFGVPKMNEDNTNYWVSYPHLILLSEDSYHKNIKILQNEEHLQGNLPTNISFAHDASSGDVNGDGHVDVFLNSVLYFGDGNGNFEIVGLNQMIIDNPCCASQSRSIVMVDKTHAHASTIGDYNNDGYDDIVIFWSNKASEDNEWGARNWNNIHLGPIDPERPPYLNQDTWMTLPEPYYGPDNANYNDADSGDINGDGYEDIVVGSTRKSPYYAGRHVQILISNGDGTFKDETIERFPSQPRAELDTSLEGTGIGEGVIVLKDVDRDGDLDIVDTQAIYGGENFEIYPRVTLAFNDGAGNFTEVPLDYFPKRMMWDYLDRYNNSGIDGGTPLIHRSGVVNLDGNGHLDFVMGFQGTLFRATDTDSELKLESVITTQSFISKK